VGGRQSVKHMTRTLVVAHLSFAQKQDKRNLEFWPPFVRPIRQGTSPFLKARSGAMSLQVRRFDHDRFRLRPFPCQRGEDTVEHSHSTPADEA